MPPTSRQVRRRRPSVNPTKLTHLDAEGHVRIVDVGAKPESHRIAIASAAVVMSRATLAMVAGGAGRKGDLGDVFATARVAGLAALKRTSDLVPLCHPVRVVGSQVLLMRDDRLPGVRLRVEVHAHDRTGVEMEALVGAASAALTVYDMIKGVDRGAEILHVRLEEKSGGRSGSWSRGDVVRSDKRPLARGRVPR